MVCEQVLIVVLALQRSQIGKKLPAKYGIEGDLREQLYK